MSDGSFYDLDPPRSLRQGDIFPNVSLISLPPYSRLVLLRRPGDRGPWTPAAGLVEAVDELAVSAFVDGNPEHVAAEARRGAALILTQTCDLDGSDLWQVCPLYSIEGSDIRWDTLTAGKYGTLLALPQHPSGYFGDSYIDLTDIRPIHRDSVSLADRIASLATASQHALTEKLARALTRPWGYAAGEEIPETGKYRCHRCNLYIGLENPERDFPAGGKFPECENCRKIHKSAQWYPLIKHKKS